MTSRTDTPGMGLTTGQLDRAALEAAIAKQSLRQRWISPLAWLGVALILIGVLVGALLVTVGENNSVTLHEPSGDPHGVIIHSIVMTVSANMPLGSRRVTYKYQDSKWHNCSAGGPQGYSDVHVEFVYYVPPVPDSGSTSGTKERRWQLNQSASAYLWNQGAVSFTAHLISAPHRLWAIDATESAFDSTSTFCSGSS